MIDGTRLLPPGHGPSANSVPFGVSDDDFAAARQAGTGGERAVRAPAEPPSEDDRTG